MARYYAPQLSIYPYHITGRCQNKMPFPIDLSLVWKIFEEELFMCTIKYGLRIHAFVLMPNHFHLLASVHEIPIGTILRELIGNTIKRINEACGKINHVWGGKTYRCVIDDNKYFMAVYRYVYQNPIRANLVSKGEDWRFSTLHRLLGQEKIFIPVEDNMLFNPLFDESCLKWLNLAVPQEKTNLIRKGLKKKIFKIKLSYLQSNPLYS